jgi:hypothetical protein
MPVNPSLIPDPPASAAERARAERMAAQGLPTPAAPTGDPVVDARVAAAYRTTANVLASATPDPSSAVRRGAVEGPGIGAAATLRGSGAASRSSKQKARGSAPRGLSNDNSGQRSAAGEA